eukprot:429312-Hanusia_phi.AAC.1
MRRSLTGLEESRFQEQSKCSWTPSKTHTFTAPGCGGKHVLDHASAAPCGRRTVGNSSSGGGRRSGQHV